MELTVDNFNEVAQALYGARARWYSIGRALKVHPFTLSVIKSRQHTLRIQFSKMLLNWLRNGKNRSWQTLVEALQTQMVGRPDLAKKIKKNYVMS